MGGWRRRPGRVGFIPDTARTGPTSERRSRKARIESCLLPELLSLRELPLKSAVGRNTPHRRRSDVGETRDILVDLHGRNFLATGSVPSDRGPLFGRVTCRCPSHFPDRASPHKGGIEPWSLTRTI